MAGIQPNLSAMQRQDSDASEISTDSAAGDPPTFEDSSATADVSNNSNAHHTHDGANATSTTQDSVSSLPGKSSVSTTLSSRLSFSRQLSFSATKAPKPALSSFFPTFAGPAPTISSGKALHAFCGGVSGLLAPHDRPGIVADKVISIENVILASLAKLDEFHALFEAISGQLRANSAHNLPEFHAQAAQLRLIYHKIDVLSDYLAAVEKCVEQLEPRVGQIEKIWGKKPIKPISNVFSALFKPKNAANNSNSSTAEPSINDSLEFLQQQNSLIDSVSSSAIEIVNLEDYFLLPQHEVSRKNSANQHNAAGEENLGEKILNRLRSASGNS
jgi:hypothetical protein